MPDNKHYKRSRHLEWREKVLRKAGYLCAECAKYGKPVAATHAHHIKSVKEYPELAYTVSNGVALCGACHNKIEPRRAPHPRK